MTTEDEFLKMIERDALGKPEKERAVTVILRTVQPFLQRCKDIIVHDLGL